MVGVIFHRDAHRGASSLAELVDLEGIGAVACDEHLPLSEALEREWEEDAHFILYRVEADPQGAEYVYARARKHGPLLAQLRAEGGDARVRVLALDHDLPEHRRWTPGEVDAHLARLAEAVAGGELPEPTWWYETLHGARLVYALERPAAPEAAEALTRALAGRLAASGVVTDPRAADWTRLFRLPRTRREDTDEPYRGLLLGPGPALDPDLLGVDVATLPPAPVGAASTPYDGDLPGPEEVAQALADGRLRRAARKMLAGREAYAVCFEEAPIDVAQGWNSGVLALVGQVVGMLARSDAVTPEGCYALIHGGLEQLQAEEDRGDQRTDWYATAWSMVCRIWAQEEAKLEAESAAKAESVAAGRDLRTELLEQVRAAEPRAVPEDADEADRWFRQRMIGSTGRHHHVMRRDGSYNVEAIPDSLLIPMIRELGMDDVIETSELRGKAWVQRSAQSIINDHATPVTSVRCSAREEVARISGDAGEKVLHIPVHRLNARVEPRFSPDVDGWLRALAGDHYDRLAEWLSWVPEVSSPICALNLYGASGTGKGMFAQGLIELFHGEHLNDEKVICTSFNIGLLRTPVVWCDEGLPAMSVAGTSSIDQAFRKFVSGGALGIVGKGSNVITADIYPRLLVTSNDRDAIRAVVGKRDLTDEDVLAIETRMLSIEVSAKARVWLTARGNYAHTRGWVHGAEEGRYVLAGHIMWLYNRRQPSKNGSGRLLVEGESMTPLVRDLRLQSPGSQSMLRALCRMIDSPQQRAGLHQAESRVWVTPAAVVEFSESSLNAGGPIGLHQAGRVLRHFAKSDAEGEHDGRIAKTSPPGAVRARWVEVDLRSLVEEAGQYGLACARAQALLAAQEKAGMA